MNFEPRRCYESLFASIIFLVSGIFSFSSFAIEDFKGIQGVNIAWSPDGKTLAFYSNYDGDNEIFLIDAYGNNIRQLTYNDIPDAMPAFTPDGKFVIYAHRGAGGWEIHQVSVSGGEPEVLIKSDEYDAFWPNPVVDGRIVFTARPKNPEVEGDQDIYVFNPETGEFISLVDSEFSENQGRLSADNLKLAFSSNRTGRLEVFVANADGSGSVQISKSPSEKERYGSAFPVFSADGSSLVFWGDDEGWFMHDHHHYRHDFETGETKVLKKRILSMAYPGLSPDGKWIAYVAAETADGNSEFYIYVMDIDGENHRRVWPLEK